MQKIVTPAPAAQPVAQLAIQAAPASALAVANLAQAAGAFLQQQQQPQQEAPPAVHDAYPAARGQLNMIQKGRPSNRTQKIITRQVFQAITCPPAVPDYLRGSETPITFSRADHPPAVPRPGHAALVVEALIGDYTLKKVFMDGGSGINIIFADTLRRINKPTTNLAASETTFHGIVPGQAVTPMGTITLDVIFGTPENFKRESIDFEVVDWKSQYHAILGRPTFARFMAVPHYAYLMLKMPGPKGVITVHGDFGRSNSCDREFSKISEFFGMEEHFEVMAVDNDKTIFPPRKKQAKDADFNTTDDTTTHQVHPTDANKTVKVSSSLPIA